jgi:hypothetical protein
MPVTLNQAARIAGKSKNTIIRALKAGKLTKSRNANKTWAIDEGELAKAFPPSGPSKVDLLEAENRELRAALERALKDIDAWRGHADAWKAQFERLAAKGE